MVAEEELATSTAHCAPQPHSGGGVGAEAVDFVPPGSSAGTEAAAIMFSRRGEGGEGERAVCGAGEFTRILYRIKSENYHGTSTLSS